MNSCEWRKWNGGTLHTESIHGRNDIYLAAEIQLKLGFFFNISSAFVWNNMHVHV